MANPSLDRPNSSKLIGNVIGLSLAVAFAWIAAYGAGEASRFISFEMAESGAPDLFREPINLMLALSAVWIWHVMMPHNRTAPPNWGAPAWGLGLGWVTGCALPGLSLLLIVALGGGVFSAKDFDVFVLILPIPFVLIHALAEEVVVRSIAQRAGHRLLGSIGGILVGALTFCLLQTSQGYVTSWNIINSALFGAVLGVVANGRGGIWAAVSGHAGWTWLETSWIGDGITFTKIPGFWAGFGPDSYGSPAFTLVLMFTLGLFGAGRALQARKDRQ